MNDMIYRLLNAIREIPVILAAGTMNETLYFPAARRITALFICRKDWTFDRK